MTNFEEMELCEYLSECNGPHKQTIMLAEECSELIQAATKAYRYCYNLGIDIDEDGVKKHVNSVVEEIADVSIMMDLISCLYRIDRDEINARKEEKLKRLAAHVGWKF